MELRSARWLATDYVRRLLLPGDCAIDATMGNGHDTLMLAEAVGEAGQVIAFDVQRQAVEVTRGRLEAAGVMARVTLHHAGHERMAELATRPARAVMMNLGWLPGGDKAVTTQLATTLAAVRAALDLLLPGGLLTVCAYPGHAEGDRERAELTAFLRELDVHQFNVLHHRFLNHPNDPPELFVVQKNL